MHRVDAGRAIALVKKRLISSCRI